MPSDQPPTSHMALTQHSALSPGLPACLLLLIPSVPYLYPSPASEIPPLPFSIPSLCLTLRQIFYITLICLSRCFLGSPSLPGFSKVDEKDEPVFSCPLASSCPLSTTQRQL